MNDEPMMIDETEDFEEPRRSTRRSWKIFQLAIAGLLSLLVVALILGERWGETFGGATEASIAEFEQAMNEYFEAAKSRELTQITMQSYDHLKADPSGGIVERDKGTYDARERVRKLAGAMNYSNWQKANAQFALRVYVYNGAKRIPADVVTNGMPDEGEPWVMRNIPAGIWLAVKTAAIAFVVTWVLLKLCELLWWFLMDRLRDISNAVRRT
jgi:hypothetical protein